MNSNLAAIGQGLRAVRHRAHGRMYGLASAPPGLVTADAAVQQLLAGAKRPAAPISAAGAAGGSPLPPGRQLEGEPAATRRGPTPRTPMPWTSGPRPSSSAGTATATAS